MSRHITMSGSAILSRKRIVYREKSGFWEETKSFVRKVTIEVFKNLFDHDWIFWLVGFLNKRLQFLESVFLVYPAEEKYAQYYFFDWRIKRHAWKPGLTGFFTQNGKLSLIFAMSAHNGAFRSPDSKKNLAAVAKRMERIRVLLNANRKSFAGILPGLLFKRGLIDTANEAATTVKIVRRAIEEVRVKEGLPRKTAVVVIGSRGFIGSQVVSSLTMRNVFGVDKVDAKNNAWPAHLKGKPAIIVNISLNSALEQYLPLMWPGVVVLNEVYPEPSEGVARFLKGIGAHLYHISGVKGKAVPRFPYGYSDGIPCCAARPTKDMEVLCKKIV